MATRRHSIKRDGTVVFDGKEVGMVQTSARPGLYFVIRMDGMPLRRVSGGATSFTDGGMVYFSARPKAANALLLALGLLVSEAGPHVKEEEERG